MDSRLLDVLHDGNYGPFGGSDSHIWSSSSNSMGLQLEETLHGILPMEPIKQEFTDMQFSSIIKSEIFDDSDDIMSKMLSYDGNINEPNTSHNITVDKYDADDYECASHSNKYIIEMDNMDDLDNSSEYSASTFRTRTDSSSIGDYESHSSDYEETAEETTAQYINKDDHDDDDDDGGDNIEDNNNDMGSLHEFIDDDLVYTDEIVVENSSFDVNTFASDQFVLDLFKNEKEMLNVLGKKERTISTNTIDSDIAGLGIKIGSNFDLTEFIINDDVPNADNDLEAVTEKSTALSTALKTIPETSKENSDLQSDTDEEFVDIETVENEPKLFIMKAKTMQEQQQQQQKLQSANVPEEVPYVDNIKSDPSWDPKIGECKLKTSKSQQKQKPLVEKTRKPSKKSKTASKRITNNLTSKKLQTDSKQATAPIATLAAGQNAPKMEFKTVEEVKSAVATQPNKVQRINTPTAVVKIAPSAPSPQTTPIPESAKISAPEPKSEPAPITQLKKKLNLEEYKKRRGGVAQSGGNDLFQKPTQTTTTLAVPTSVASTPISNVLKSPVKHSEEVVSIVRSLKEDNLAMAATDPITLAKNKVLRMKELKKARAMKIIDSRVAAKVPRVTQVLPLKEIVKDTCYTKAVAADDDVPRIDMKSQFEEKIYVSAGMNTNITIPPEPKLQETVKKINSRSLLKSNILLKNISSTIEKVQESSKEIVVIPKPTSLLSSIQSVVVKNAMPELQIKLNAVKSSPNNAEQHGENKVIMHLRKDRIRIETVGVGTQTEFLSEFPLLKWKPTPRNYRKQNREHSESEAEDSISSPPSSKRHRSSISSSYSEHERERLSRARQQKRTMRKQKHEHNSSSSSNSDQSDYSRNRSGTRSRSRNRSRSRSGSRSSYYRYRSRSRSRSRSPSGSRGRYNYGYNNNNNNKRHYQNRNVPKPEVEERRIVYVGRIEEETTKEILRRKFIRYGTIKSISIHYKENGMKYGFVTFESPQDAFTVIEDGAKDTQINMYDLSFGGRRAFCRTSYSDLDNAGFNTYQSIVFPQPVVAPKEEDSFEALLLKVKAKLNANKATNNNNNNKSNNNNNKDKNKNNNNGSKDINVNKETEAQ